MVTLQDLSQLYCLRREIASDKERLRELRIMSTSAAVPTLTGMPAVHGESSRVEQYVVAIAELEGVIRDKLLRCVQLQTELERFISGIPDSRLRLIFTARFSEGLSWVQVADRVGGTASEDSVKHLCYRYLDSIGVRDS